MKPRAPKNRLLAAVLSLSMTVSIFSCIAITSEIRGRAADNAFDDLYIREADENTMDSYIQASLGGYIYKERVKSGTNIDAVTMPTVRNNFGSRYAGEVWSDLSVFAKGQKVIGEIRPFEEGGSYTEDELAIAGTPLPDGVRAGTKLTAEQADALNKAANESIQKYYDNPSSYAFKGDGDFNGQTLQLERHTDGVTSTVSLDENSDFLQVFSALGSSQLTNDNVTLPLDVVFVLDTSSTMGYSHGDYYRLVKAAKALNNAMQVVLQNENNRVALVTYDTNAEIYLPLDHYEPIKGRKNVYTDKEGIDHPYPTGFDGNHDKDYIVFESGIDNTTTTAEHTNFGFPSGTVKPGSTSSGYNLVRNFPSYNYGKYTFQYFQLNVQSKTQKVDGGDEYKKYNDWICIHSGTNTHQGLYEGLNILRNEEKTTTVVNTVFGPQKVPRIPVVVLLSDGAPSYVTTSDENARKTGDQRLNYSEDAAPPLNDTLYVGDITEWWEPDNPAYQSGDGVNNEELNDKHYRVNLVGTPTYKGWGLALPIFLMAANMKQKVNEHYFDAVDPTEYPGTQIITVGVDPISTSLNQLNGDMTEYDLMTTTLNPKEALWQEYIDANSSNATIANAEYTNYIYQAALRYLQEDDTLEDLKLQVEGNGSWAKIVRPTEEEIKNDDIKEITLDGMRYNDAYYDVKTDDLATELKNIVSRLKFTGEVFTPLSGTNAAGVGDSVTYSNPIGEYMIVDDVTDVTMFGEHYAVSRRAVYDYKVNQAIAGGRIFGQDDEGWYEETTDPDGNVTYKKYTGTPSSDLWSAGYVYRICYTTAQQYVPTLAEQPNYEQLTEKQKNTTYTIYTITGEYKGGKQSADATPTPIGTNTTRQNLSYIIENDKDDKGNRSEVSKVTFDLLEDVKMWVEDTGDYRDEGGLVLESGYSEALFVNIGVEALPTQVARIDLNPKTFVPISYETNLNDPKASTPLRVYFSVSLDPHYLRYKDEDAEKDLDKSQAVGVALSKMEPTYLTKNTDTNFIVNGEKTDERYTAFYSNYFSDTKYKDYPVYADDSKESRGDPAVSFSPSAENQFYRFQKNRVLFVIPGSYGLDERPSEIDLGNLNNLYIAENGTWYYYHEEEDEDGNTTTTWTDKDGKSVSFSDEESDEMKKHKIDTSNYTVLLGLLNEKRGNIDGNGTKSTYWWFGDCVPVDGGDIIDDGGDGFDERTEKYPEAAAAANAQALLEKFQTSLGGLTVQPQISSDNWYYIIREYYYPIFGDDGTKGETDQVEVHFMAIARKGVEFGSGLAGGGVMGSEIEWFNPTMPMYDDDGTKRDDYRSDFTADKSTHYGYPDENNVTNIDPNDPSKGHTHNGSWYVSASPGGLRVGGMANFAGVKGYDIRGGVGEGEFKKDKDVIAQSNVTNRALTYFLPTISRNASGNAVVNLYLGNEGRILVPDTLLLVTKLVQKEDEEAGEPVFDLTDKTPFRYTITIQGFTGERSAVKVKWDEEAKTWRRIIGSIDAVTNAGLLQNADGSLARVNKDGTFNAEGGYYVYIPSVSSAGTVESITVYDYNGDKVTIGGRNENTDGEIEFIAQKVYLIPVNDYRDNWTFDPNKQYESITVNPNPEDPGTEGDTDTPATGFVIAKMYPSAGTDSSEITLNSEYNIKTSYLSESLTFDDDGNATFELKSGEGLLFNGIQNGFEYTVTEELSNDQVNEGWQFLSVNGHETEPDPNPVDGYTYTFNDAGHTYTVSGKTGTKEASVHYINTLLTTGIAISKVLEEETGTTIGDQDRKKEFSFKLSLSGGPADISALTTLTYTIRSNSAEDGTGDRTGRLLPYGYDGEPAAGDDDLIADENGVWTFKLKADEVFYVDGLPEDEDTEYTFTVTEVGDDSAAYYPKTGEGESLGADGSLTKTGTVGKDKRARVEFVNIKPAPEPVTISLTATKMVTDESEDKTAPELEKDQYSFTITPVNGNPANDPLAGGRTVTNGTGNDVSLITLFDEVEYTTPGTYIYRVSEIRGEIPGISYDTAIRTVKVVIEEEYDDHGNYTGKLKATVTVTVNGEEIPNSGNAGTFNNTYDPSSVSIILDGFKILDKGELTADQFTFELIGIGDAPMPGDGAGNADESDETDETDGFEEPAEDDETNTPVGDDETGESVGDDEQPDEPIETVEPDLTDTPVADSAPADTSAVDTIPGTVTETDDDPAQDPAVPENDEIMSLAEGAPDSVTVGNDKNGVFSFGTITFTEPGTYFYQIREVIPEDADVSIDYDRRVYEIEVTVTNVDGALMAVVKINPATEVTFKNEALYGDLTVSKTVTGNAADFSKEFNFTVELGDTDISGIYGEMTFTDGKATFTLKNGQSKTATGLPAGITYTVTETEANEDGYTTTANGATGTIPAKKTAKAAFINSKTSSNNDDDDEYGNLTVKKTVTGDAGDPEKEFTFTVTLRPAISGTYGNMKFTNGVATVKLKHGESVRATGLPAGTSYTVTEAEADQDGYTTTATGASGTIPANGTATAEFVNDRDEEPDPETGDLTVSKTVSGNAGDLAREFHFTVVLSDREINGTYGGMTFVNGVAEFTLRHGGSKTATGLPAGISYTVMEAEADGDGYVTSASGSTGTIPGGGIASAGFTNTKDEEIEPGEGNLIVSKIVGGTEGDRNQQFTFTVTLSDNTINGTYGDMTFVNGVARFTLRHGESRVARGLPAGVTYSVTEAEANQDGYTSVSKGRNGTIPEGGTAQATFFNTRGEPLPDDPPLEDFDDPPIPMGDAPEFPDTTNPPVSPAPTNPPKTGDDSHLTLWLTVMILSATGLLIIGLYSNRKRILFSYKGKHTKK